MKYLKALTSKKLKVEQLPKGVQGNIRKIESLLADVEEYKDAYLDDKGKASLELAKEMIIDLDKKVERAINRFDPVVYQKKLDVIKSVRDKKEKLNKDDEIVEELSDKEIVDKVKEVIAESPVINTVQDDGLEVFKTFTEDDRYPRNGDGSVTIDDSSLGKHINEDAERYYKDRELDELKGNVEINVDEFETVTPPPENSVQEIEAESVEDEFAKKGDAKPRKMSKGIILMGIGAFILTWGAVNFFRESRG